MFLSESICCYNLKDLGKQCVCVGNKLFWFASHVGCFSAVSFPGLVIQASVRRSCTAQAKLRVHPVLEAVHTRSLSWPALCWLGSFLLKSPLNIIKKIAKNSAGAGHFM